MNTMSREDVYDANGIVPNNFLEQAMVLLTDNCFTISRVGLFVTAEFLSGKKLFTSQLSCLTRDSFPTRVVLILQFLCEINENSPRKK